eukprot:COSAG01_NODE_13574_length_1566_cov_1.111111_1_plen_332_part_00
MARATAAMKVQSSAVQRLDVLRRHLLPPSCAAAVNVAPPPSPLPSSSSPSSSQLAIDLSGHIAIVTGSTGMLGRSMCRTLAAAGADVAVHYRSNPGKAEELCRQIRGMGRRACAVHAHVDDERSVRAMAAEVTKVLGEVSIVVANAVQQYEWTSVLEQSTTDFDSQYRTCTLQNVLLAQAFVPAMIKRGWGRVIAISSVCAMECAVGQGAYDAGKRGMDGVLRVLAREVGPDGITVNTVAPGFMLSKDHADATDSSISYNQRKSDDGPGHFPRLQNADDEAQRNRAARTALGRLGYDDDVAAAVAFLASDLASQITGLFMPVAGGTVMPTI